MIFGASTIVPKPCEFRQKVDKMLEYCKGTLIKYKVLARKVLINYVHSGDNYEIQTGYLNKTYTCFYREGKESYQNILGLIDNSFSSLKISDEDKNFSRIAFHNSKRHYSDQELRLHISTWFRTFYSPPALRFLKR